ncbi:hypothetical protein K502DRAFT_347203 [Neoconidiobolus thromboides FSU 785]|nr:hypothetical protein K502DRAFT_347203 [Neoconidiobolus thromboides FSU 785]
MDYKASVPSIVNKKRKLDVEEGIFFETMPFHMTEEQTISPGEPQNSSVEIHNIPLNVVCRPIPPVLDDSKVEIFRRDLENGADFPPIDVHEIEHEGNFYYYAFGGCHRWRAHQLSGKQSIKAKIIPTDKKVGIMYLKLFALSSALKVLLFNGYHSTDFEVHRNWLAITYSLPINQWYYEKTSEWTLDYPPFFAWFEYCLSHFAKHFDPKMLVINNLNYKSTGTIYFQRFSVIVSELVLIYALYRLSNLKEYKSNSLSKIMVVLTFLNPCLLIVDHIHFQYNGFMFGILLLSLVEAIQTNYISSGILFAILLNFKHIFLYLAPAYFVFLLRAYCMNVNQGGLAIVSFLKRLSLLGLCVIFVFLISLFPFVYYEQLPQLLSRLFPFQRGLSHAYWAPNVWAVYSFIDRCLLFILSKYDSSYQNVASVTRGLVGDVQFGILPQILPKHTFILTLLAQLPILVKLWINPNTKNFLNSIVLCGFGSYLFGWHVHEKAIMMVLLPLSFICIENRKLRAFHLFINVVANFSLLPLVFYKLESIIVSIILLIWAICASSLLNSVPSSILIKVYYAGFAGLNAILLVSFFEVDMFLKYSFLPLLLTSIYCAIGIIGSWAYFYFYALKL